MSKDKNAKASIEPEAQEDRFVGEYLSGQGEHGLLISNAIHAFNDMRTMLDKRNGLRTKKGHSLIKYNPVNGQGRILLLLEESGEMTQADMARALDIKPQTLSASIRKLEAHGHVKRRRDVLDARTQNVSITESGKKVIEDFEVAAKYSGSIFEALDDEELRQTIVIFKKLQSRIINELQVNEALDEKLA